MSFAPVILILSRLCFSLFAPIEVEDIQLPTGTEVVNRVDGGGEVPSCPHQASAYFSLARAWS